MALIHIHGADEFAFGSSSIDMLAMSFPSQKYHQDSNLRRLARRAS